MKFILGLVSILVFSVIVALNFNYYFFFFIAAILMVAIFTTSINRQLKLKPIKSKQYKQPNSRITFKDGL